MNKDTVNRQAAIDVIRNCNVKEVTPAYMLIDKAEAMLKLMMLPPALKYTGESICVYCQTTNCKGCMYEPMTTEEGK